MGRMGRCGGLQSNRVNVRQPSRASSLPQVLCCCCAACSPRIQCGSELARESGGSVNAGVDGDTAFASKLAPTGFCVVACAACPPRIQCGSELARENGGSVNAGVGCGSAFASRLAPTGCCVVAVPHVRPGSSVGASLLAKEVG